MTIQRSRFWLPFSFGLLGLVTICISKIVEIVHGEKNYIIAYTASGLIMVSVIIMKYYSIDEEKFRLIIKGTNPLSGELPTTRYTTWMVRAMILGFVATIVINSFNFILGMIIYLFMQFALIIAFSGIHSLRLRNYLKEGTNNTVKYTPLVAAFFWAMIGFSVYFGLAYSGGRSIVVIPYVIALITMAHFTWYSYAFKERSMWFRLMPVIGSIIFVFSDALIGNTVYHTSDSGLYRLDEWTFTLIDITYVINIFFLSQAILFLKDKSGRTPFKSE